MLCKIFTFVLIHNLITKCIKFPGDQLKEFKEGMKFRTLNIFFKISKATTENEDEKSGKFGKIEKNPPENDENERHVRIGEEISN